MPLEPASGQVVTEVSKATVEDTRAALQAADAAFPLLVLDVGARTSADHTPRDGHFPVAPGRICPAADTGTRQAAERLAQGMPLQRRRDRLLCRRRPPVG